MLETLQKCSIIFYNITEERSSIKTMDNKIGYLNDNFKIFNIRDKKKYTI